MTDRAGAEHPSSSHVGQFWVHIDTNSQSPLRIKHQLPMGRGPENTSFIISLPISESTCPPPRNNLPLSPISELGSWILEDSKLVLTHAEEKAAVIIPINPHLLLGPLAHTGSCTCPKGLSISCSWYCPPCSKAFHIHSVLLPPTTDLTSPGRAPRHQPTPPPPSCCCSQARHAMSPLSALHMLFSGPWGQAELSLPIKQSP